MIDLGGDWLLREALGGTWRWYLDKPLEPAPQEDLGGNNVGTAAAAVAAAPGWLPARLPSSVRGDLVRAGEIPSPYVARDSKASEWVSERHWVYRRTCALPRPLGPGEVAFLELDAVDPRALVFVDGVQVGEACGPFGTSRIDVTAALGDGGEHGLALVLEPGAVSQPQVGRTDEVLVHAPRMTYGWDFCPRLVHQGVWGPLRVVAGTAVDGGTWATTSLADDGRRGIVHLRTRLHAAAGSAVDVRVLVDGVEAAAGEVVASPDGVAALDLEAIVADPERWWPHGLGAQRRYAITVEVDGAAVWQRRVGFRTAVWEHNPGAPAGAEPYSLRVNGQAVRLTGWNWAPADALYGEITRERLRHLMLLARDGGAHLLRIWGGGLIETADFYDLADELGLLVWQELSQSSSGQNSTPSQDPGFVDLLRRAAREAVRARGHHPSLVLWGGGNELDLDGVPLRTEQSPALSAAARELAALDPERRWVSTSPTGPVFHNRLDVIAADPEAQHDVHGPWEHQGLVDHYTLYNAGTSLAHTEFGVEGMASARQYAALLPGDPRPLDRSNPAMRHLGEWWNNARLVHAAFGGRLLDAGGREDVDAVRRASQQLQATGLGYAVEADLRRAPRCSMVLPWQLAESFPNAWCTAVVEYHGDTKAAYHAVARAFAERRVTLRVERAAWEGCAELGVEAWVWADPARPVPPGSTVSVALRDLAGTVLAQAEHRLEGIGNPRPATALRVPARDVAGHGPLLVWTATWAGADGVVLDEETALLRLGADWGPVVDLPTGQVRVAVSADAAVTDAAATVPDAAAPETAAPDDTAPDDTAHGGTRLGDADLGDTVWQVEVTNTGPVALVGLRVLDPRPAGVAGRLRLRLDPAPLLPGRTTTITATWDGVPHDERSLVVDAWNLPPTAVTAGPPAANAAIRTAANAAARTAADAGTRQPTDPGDV